MKQVIIYNQVSTTNHGGKRFVNEELFNFFRAQIDWSLHLGWSANDIILGTNFDFEYNGVKNYYLYDICKYSGFNNFWYGAVELLSADLFGSILGGEDFWLHDQDSWPVRYFDFPTFDGEIAGCEYQGTKEWNCGSIYCKNTSQSSLQFIVNLMKDYPEANVSSDEDWISWCRNNEESKIKDVMSSINTRYNCGITHFDKRFKVATKPINVFSFRPDVEENMEIIEKHLPKEMLDIFIKNNLRSK